MNATTNQMQQCCKDRNFYTKFLQLICSGMSGIYSQFVKTSIDFRYYTQTSKKGWVTRFYAGTGYSYGNSTVMPYVEQFYSGGSNSLHGFAARALGQGSYKPKEYNGIIDQTGDIKLEINTAIGYPF